ncbi:hypothetical protein AB0A92_19570 [Streptomyces celluloflavus]
MYAFALWEHRTEELLLIRDQLGIKPLFCHPLGDGVLFDSEPKAILANPQRTPSTSLEGLCGALSASITQADGSASHPASAATASAGR